MKPSICTFDRLVVQDALKLLAAESRYDLLFFFERADFPGLDFGILKWPSSAV
jgi:hypothetical protein